MTLVQMIHSAADNLLFEEAARGSEGFRQWYYPGLPQDSTVNPQASEEIHYYISRGKSANDIREILVKKHSQGE